VLKDIPIVYYRGVRWHHLKPMFQWRVKDLLVTNTEIIGVRQPLEPTPSLFRMKEHCKSLDTFGATFIYFGDVPNELTASVLQAWILRQHGLGNLVFLKISSF
jgi:hypothetical protein